MRTDPFCGLHQLVSRLSDQLAGRDAQVTGHRLASPRWGIVHSYRTSEVDAIARPPELRIPVADQGRELRRTVAEVYDQVATNPSPIRTEKEPLWYTPNVFESPV
jgi:hypothetical protein